MRHLFPGPGLGPHTGHSNCSQARRCSNAKPTAPPSCPPTSRCPSRIVLIRLNPCVADDEAMGSIQRSVGGPHASAPLSPPGWSAPAFFACTCQRRHRHVVRRLCCRLHRRSGQRRAPIPRHAATSEAAGCQECGPYCFDSIDAQVGDRIRGRRIGLPALARSWHPKA